MENQTKFNAVITALLFVISGYTILGIIEKDTTHYCEMRELQAYCFDLSGGLGTRCYTNPTKTTWRVCSEGWKEIPFESTDFVQSKGSGGSMEHCDSEGCR